MYYYYYDATYILVIFGALLTLLAQWYVSHTFKKYSRVRTYSGMSGAETADRILKNNGYYEIQLRSVRGNLTDHYDPRNGTVNLSESVCQVRSIAAVSVAAHECGHVCQHEEGYLPLSIRTALVPIANFGSNAGIWIVILSLFLGLSYPFAMIGVLLFAFGVLFQIVTLPVEFNASSRGLRMLDQYGILTQDELHAARKVLRAAALTYVASAAASILQLLRLLLIVGGRRRD